MFEVSCVLAEFDSGRGDPHAAQLQRIDIYVTNAYIDRFRSFKCDI